MKAACGTVLFSVVCSALGTLGRGQGLQNPSPVRETSLSLLAISPEVSIAFQMPRGTPVFLDHVLPFALRLRLTRARQQE